MRRLINLLSYDFWIKLWRVSHLCGCSCLDVSGIPRDSTMVSELRFDEGFDWLLMSKVFLQEVFRRNILVSMQTTTAVQVQVCADERASISG